LRLHQAGLDAQAWARWPKALARGDGSVLGDWSPARIVESLQKLCHDMQAVQAGAEARFFSADDLPPAADPNALGAWWRDLAATSRTVEHPFNAGLLLEDLVTRARTALNSRQKSR
jgi:DNA polymerase-3 subunit delta'